VRLTMCVVWYAAAAITQYDMLPQHQINIRN